MSGRETVARSHRGAELARQRKADERADRLEGWSDDELENLIKTEEHYLNDEVGWARMFVGNALNIIAAHFAGGTSDRGIVTTANQLREHLEFEGNRRYKVKSRVERAKKLLALANGEKPSKAKKVKKRASRRSRN